MQEAINYIPKEQAILWRTVIDDQPQLIPGVCVKCDADNQHATIQVRLDGQVQRLKVPYTALVVRS